MMAHVSNAQTLIVADAYIDVVKGKRVQNALIEIENERIVSVKSGQYNANDYAGNIIDLRGHTLLPGLIDSHTHLTSDPTQHGFRRLTMTQTRKALQGVKFAETTLNAGITTVRNLGAGGFIDVALKQAIADGDITGPRMFVSGPSLQMTGGHGDNNLLPHDIAGRSPLGVVDGPWDAVQKVRNNVKYGADLIKIKATGGVLSKGTKIGAQDFSLEEMSAIVGEAKRRGITVAAHAHGSAGINDAIRAGVTSVEHASMINEEGIALAKKNGTYLSMDIYVTEYILGEGEAAGILPESLEKERKVGTVQRSNFSKAVDAGVNIVMGTDAGVYPHGDNLKQLSRMVKFGMTPIQALQAASINAANMLEQSNNIGSLQTGRYADIIAVKGNPLNDIALLENVAFVMKGGEVIKHAQ
ncbi:MAG: amidohydrolase family protein [Glaciecola sp.]